MDDNGPDGQAIAACPRGAQMETKHQHQLGNLVHALGEEFKERGGPRERNLWEVFFFWLA